MGQEKSEDSASDASRRKFLKRSGVVLLPYAAPLIVSMAIHVEDAEAQSKSRRRFSPRMMMMTRMMMSPSSPSPSS